MRKELDHKEKIKIFNKTWIPKIDQLVKKLILTKKKNKKIKKSTKLKPEWSNKSQWNPEMSAQRYRNLRQGLLQADQFKAKKEKKFWKQKNQILQHNNTPNYRFSLSCLFFLINYIESRTRKSKTSCPGLTGSVV